MTIEKTIFLLNNPNSTHSELLDCLDELCKEYGYIQGVIKAEFRNKISGENTLAEIQNLIEELKRKLKLP